MASKLTNYINGEFVTPKSGKYFDNVNPATDKVINLVPDSDERDVLEAVNAARKAYPAWRDLHFSERAEYLMKIAAEMKKASMAEELARADSNDMGKPIMFSRMDVQAGTKQFESFAGLINSVTTPYFQMKDAVSLEHRDPIGLVGCISPWNFPAMIFCGKIAPALACGNCVIAKPSELSPTSAYLMCKIFEKAGVPKGVINVIHGYGAKAGEPIVSNEHIGAISFTGGTVTGKRISSIAAPMLKKLQLELGGKNPAIVFDDCYFEETIAGIALSEFWNSGQVCCSGSRLIIDKKICDKFLNGLMKYVKENYTKNVGNPLEETTMMGPLASKPHFYKVKGYLELISKEGGKIIFGGGYQENGVSKNGFKLNDKYNNNEYKNGYYVEPTIVVNLGENTRCVKEEIFGPILTVHTFETEKEAIELANDTRYGLAANLWTSDIRRGQRVARQLEAGTVWINTYGTGDHRQAFGGYKNSGVQRENGLHSIEFYSEIKSIVSKL